MEDPACHSNTAVLRSTGGEKKTVSSSSSSKLRWCNRPKLAVPGPDQKEVQPQRQRWSLSPQRRLTTSSSEQQQQHIQSQCTSAAPPPLLCPKRNVDSEKERKNVDTTKSAHNNNNNNNNTTVAADADEKGRGKQPSKVQRQRWSISPQRRLKNAGNPVPTPTTIQRTSGSPAELDLSSKLASGGTDDKPPKAAEKRKGNTQQQQPKLQQRQFWCMSPQRRLPGLPQQQQQNKNQVFVVAAVPSCTADPALEDTSIRTTSTCSSSLSFPGWEESNRQSTRQTKTQSHSLELSSHHNSFISVHPPVVLCATNSPLQQQISDITLASTTACGEERVIPEESLHDLLELPSSNLSTHSVRFDMEIMVHEHVVSNSYGLGPAQRSLKKPIRGEFEIDRSFKRASHTRCPAVPVVVCTPSCTKE